MLLDTTIPDKGWDTMKTVIKAHCGCCKSKRNASQSASPAARSVLIANFSANVVGAKKAFHEPLTGVSSRSSPLCC